MDSRLDGIILSILIYNLTRSLHIVRAVYITVKFARNRTVKFIDSIESLHGVNWYKKQSAIDFR